jgi:MORN repeat
MRLIGCDAARLASRILRHGAQCAVALFALAFVSSDLWAQPDPFRSSAPQAARPARPPQPGAARQAAPPANASADFMWVTDPRNDCRAQIRRREGLWVRMNWDGNCPNGVAQGAGTLILLFADASRTVCQVTLRAGLLQGRGVCVFAGGHRYEAEYVAGRPVGPGTLSFPDGSRYDGMVRFGLPHGRGTLVGPGFSPLTGEWEYGCLYVEKSGRFVAVLRDADTCAGESGRNPN